MGETAWVVGAVLYGVVWLIVAHRLFNTHQAPPRQWRERSFRVGLAFQYALLALFWPLGGLYLIIRGGKVE